jgi:hypothetical protein
VAVLLAAAEHIKQKKEIPLLAVDDDLFLTLFDDNEDYFEDDGEWPDEEEEPEYAVEPQSERKNGKPQVRKIIEAMGKEELEAMLVDLADRYPEIKRGILEKEQLATGRVDKMVSSLRREIRNLTNESAWYNPWKGEGNIPDYSHVRE